DADIAIWDPGVTRTLTHDLIRDGADYTPYEGIEITGWPVLTMLRGKTVVREGEVVGQKGRGQHLAREKSPFAVRREPGTA
ncbi:MAG: hypothetical protein B7X76_04910, partial [Azorhizobium sp. 39-67-5]